MAKTENLVQSVIAQYRVGEAMLVLLDAVPDAKREEFARRVESARISEEDFARAAGLAVNSWHVTRSQARNSDDRAQRSVPAKEEQATHDR